jgi:exonuclease III
MFHPVIVTVCFSLIYLVCHIYPSLSTLPTYYNLSDQSVIYQTATTQFESLNTIPISFILSSPRIHFRHTGNIFLSILILLSGDIQSNPGPISTHSCLNMCTLNIRSLTKPLHYTALADIAESSNIHIFALTETWINPNTTSAQLFDSIPHGFTLISNPRPVSSSNTSSVVGGGTAFLIREPFTLISSPEATFKSFEMSTVTLKLPHSKLSLFNIYRPPSSFAKSRDSASFSQFLDDFQTLISSISTLSHDFLITGDFNIHVDDLTDSSALQFISLLDLANLTQHVSFPTHRLNHTLDLIITSSDTIFVLLYLNILFHLQITFLFSILCIFNDHSLRL